MEVAPTPELMAEIDRLRLTGRILQAWEKLRQLTDPATWTQVDWRVSAARVKERLGAREECQREILRLWRRHHGTDRAPWEEMAWTVHSNRGPVEAWRWLRRWKAPKPGTVRDEQDQLCLHAYVAAAVRDFGTARRMADEAQALDAAYHWPYCVQGTIQGWADRHEEALALAEEALRREPDSIASHHLRADSLVALGKDDEAVRGLTEAEARLETGSLAWTLTVLRMELGDFAGASQSLARTEELHPLAEPALLSGLAALHCDLACHLGEWDAAAQWAGRVEKSAFYAKVHEQLQQRRDGLRRVLLPVGFTRQQHLTCVPATLTTLARYWGRPAEHLELAEAMCHDGTPYHSERKWAMDRGWVSREFTVTAEAAKALIDRGVPFTISTVHAGGGHCQAVVGYDEYRRVLLIRDPYHRSKGEFLIDETLEQQKAHGPRGHVIVPAEEAARLDGVPLPDSALWDLHHVAATALNAHDRPTAERALAELQWSHPGHRLALECQAMLAHYDGRPAVALEAVNGLLEQFPGSVNHRMRQLSLLQQLEKTPERLERLRAACEGPDAHPMLWREYATALFGDARRHAEMRRWLRRSDRREVSAASLWLRAHFLWQQDERDEATDLHRLAACLEDKNEGYVEAYFHAARWSRRTDEALAHLTDRFARDGSRSSAPAQTLFGALESLDRQKDALDVLREASRRRPEDDDFKVWAAERFAVWSTEAEAAEVLATTSKARRASRSKVEAWLASRRGDRAEVERLWRDVLEEFPLSVEAVRMVASAVHDRQGPAAALQFVRDRAGQHPHFLPLKMAVIDHARGEGPPEWEIAVRDLLQFDPDNAWGLRELARALVPQQRHDEALAALAAAEALEPGAVALHWIRGEALESMGRSREAAECHRQALAVSVDHEPAMRRLVALAESSAERGEALAFVQAELIRQTTNGNGVLTFAELARPYLPAEELGKLLALGHAERPDLWQSGIVLARHHSHCGRMEEAAALAVEQTRRFPLLPRIWVECALVHREALRREEEIAALEQARALNPAWGWAMRELAQSYRFTGRFDKSREVMEQAVRHAPGDAWNHGWLAEELRHAGDNAAAIDALERAVRFDPSYSWAWESLAAWTAQAGKSGRAEAVARELARERPGDATVWMALASTLAGRDAFPERVECLDRAIALTPRSLAARDEKARLLATVGKFEEALQACRDWPVVGTLPTALEARAAWVTAAKGDVRGAVAAMEKVVERDPGWLWGWENLATWHQQLQQYDEAEDAIAALARLQPHHAVPHGFLGEFRLARGKTDAAKKALARSIEIDPGYQFGGFQLFDLHLQEREHAEAEGVLDRIAPHLHQADVLARRTALQLSRHDDKAFERELDALLSVPDDRPSAFHYLAEWIKHRSFNLAAKVERAARSRLLSDRPCNPHTAAFVTDMCLLRGATPDAKVIQSVGTGSTSPEHSELRKGPAGHADASLPRSAGAGNPAAARVHVRLLNHMAKRVQEAETLTRWLFRLKIWWTLRKHREWFHADVDLWGAGGHALFCAQRPAAAATWMSDWRAQSAAKPWMFNNLVVSLHQLGRLDEALAVRRHVLGLPEHDDVMQRFQLWQALDEARAGQFRQAASRLAATNQALDDTYDSTLRNMAKLFVDLRSGEVPPALSEATKRQLRVFLATHRRDKALRPACWELARLWDRKAGGMRVRWWWITVSQRTWVAVAALAAIGAWTYLVIAMSSR